ncbi:transglutaminase-like cysteine peptidase [Sulfitobacter sediminilitoris]
MIGPASAKGFLTTGKFTSPPVGAISICKTYSWACSPKSNGHTIALSELNRVNRTINRKVYQINDHVQYGVPEKWTLPSRRGGDCEDIALLKKLELIRKGVAPNKLLIATALDRKLRPHAVLVFRSDHGDLVLDSAHGKILAWADTGYTFLRMQDPSNPRKWQALLRGGVANSKRVYVKSRGVAAISPYTGAKSQSRSRDRRPTLDR